ncbi:predicted exporters of the rnd superfamily [Methylocaldum marinum]|uniref:Predicted exporters of the rnd superfamily n=1 Tax=Methylocaldum marinum TaxID=1432792 RepID=A0A250KXU4_9GAMM|nr:MMPL family transporter [Methylocaldum marinum]BBA36445.1 predicted exporters of the rnd superfamily [Methylocaldum marinum]
MENFLLKVGRFFFDLPDRILRFKWPILIALIGASAVMVLGALTRLHVNTSANSFLAPDDPAMVALDNFRAQFGGDDTVVLVYRARNGDVFSGEALTAVQALTEDLLNWQDLEPGGYTDANGRPVDLTELKHIRDVRSLSNIRVQSAQGDTLRSERLLPRHIPETPAALSEIKAKAMAKDYYRLAYFSNDGQYGAVVIKTDFGVIPEDGYVPAVDGSEVSLDDSLALPGAADPGYDADADLGKVVYKKTTNGEYARFVKSLKSVYAKYDGTLDFYPVGYPPLMEFVQKVLNQAVGLNIGMVLINVVLLWLLFRSFSAVLWPMVTIILSIVWVCGAAAWSGTQVSTMITLALMLVFVCGIADCVHVMNAYLLHRRAGLAHRSALSTAYGETGLPMFVTSVTNMVGTCALVLSDLLPIRVFAVLSTLGVGMAYLFTLVLLPILLDIWHPVKAHAPTRSGRLDRLAAGWRGLSVAVKLPLAIGYCGLLIVLGGPELGGFIATISLMTYFTVAAQTRLFEGLPGLAARHSFKILVIFAVVFAACLYGKSQVRVDSSLVELTREGSDIRVAYETADRHMAGTQTMEIMIDTGASEGILNPALLARMDTLQRRVLARYPEEISRTFSLADIVKETNQLMHGDDPAYFSIPDSQILISQLLYLYNSANPSDRRSLVSDDYSQSHIALNVYSAGSYQYKRFFAELGAEIDRTFADLKAELPDLKVTLTGSVPLMMRTQDIIATSQYGSFMLALAVISAIMVLTLGSLQAGLLAIIPNLIPSLFTYGLLGLLGIPLDTDTLLLAPVIIGLSVDDTTHFITHYRMALVKTRDMTEALRGTIVEVGPAVVSTGMVLGLGFGILSFSDYLGTAKMGFFGALSIFVGVLCELFLLPALLLIFKPKFGLKDLAATFDLQRQSV